MSSSTELNFVDDFLNTALNADYMESWRGVAAGTGSSVLPVTTGVEGHPGIARLDHGTTSSGAATLVSATSSGGNNGSILSHATNAITIDAVVRFPTLPDATNNFTATIGLARLVNLSSDVYSMQVLHNGTAAVFRLMTNINAGANTTVDGSTTLVAGQWYHMQLVFTTALVTLNIDGVEEATSSTDVPSGVNRGGGPIIRMNSTAGTLARQMDVDLFRIQQTVAARLS